MVTLFQIFAPDARESTLSRITGWCRQPRRNTLAGSRDNIHRHYDIGNEFYALWLGRNHGIHLRLLSERSIPPSMQAQIAKMDHVCRKLRLGAGATQWSKRGAAGAALTLHMAAPLRRQGAGVQHFPRTARICARRARRAGTRTPGGVRRRRLPQHQWDLTMPSCRSGCSSTSGGSIIPSLGRVVRGALTMNGRGLIHSIGRNRPGRCIHGLSGEFSRVPTHPRWAK